MDALDDAAAAALYLLQREKREHVGALYADGDGYGRTPTAVGGSSHVKGGLRIPQGSLRGLFHNHPSLPGRSARELSTFSDGDKDQARKLGVPSYISAGLRTMRYDPSTEKSQEVLAQMPVEEIRKLYLPDLIRQRVANR